MEINFCWYLHVLLCVSGVIYKREILKDEIGLITSLSVTTSKYVDTYSFLLGIMNILDLEGALEIN